MRKLFYKIILFMAALFLVSPSVWAKTLTLQDCFEFAKNYHETLPLAQQDIAHVKAQKWQMIGALTPRFSAYYTENLQERIPVAGSVTQQNFTRFRTPQVKIVASQPLFHGLSEYYALRQNHFSLKNKQASLQEALRLLYIDVLDAFTNAVLLEKDLSQTHKDIQILIDQKRELIDMERVGKIRLSERYFHEAQLTQMEQQKEMLLAEKKVAYEILSVLTGLSPHPQVQMEELSSSSLADKDIQDTVKQRPDVLVKAYQVEESRMSLNGTRGQLLPQADLNAQYYLHRVGLQENIHWDMNIQVEIPLFDLSTFAKIRESKSDVQKKKLELKQIKREALSSAIQQQSIFLSYKKQLSQAKKGAFLSQRAFELARQDFQKSLIDRYTLSGAQRSWIDARHNLSVVEVNYFKAYHRFLLEAGIQ